MSIEIIYSIVLFTFVIVSSYLAMYVINKNKFSQELLLIFGSSYLFVITLVHLIPQLFSHNNVQVTSLIIVSGFFFQLFLDYFSEGLEHGHTYHKNKNRTLMKPYVIIFSLCIHSFFESTLLTSNYHHDFHYFSYENDSSFLLLWGILIHKFPATVAIISMLKAHFKNLKIWIYLTIFALSAPFGLFSVTSLSYLININYLHAFVCGMVLHLALVIFFENNKGHEPKVKRIITILLACLVAVIGLFI